MYGVVRPFAESILSKTALRRQSRRPVTAYATGAAHTTRPPRTADAAHTTCTAYASGPPYTADATHTTGTTYASRPAYTTDATYTTGTTYASRPTYTTHATYTADTTHATRPTHTTDAAGDGVAIEVVEVVDINIPTSPAATPAPTAAPPRSHQNSRTERDCGACRVVAGRIGDGRIWIRSFTVYSRRLIRRHVHNFRIGRLDHNHALVFYHSCINRLLLSSLQSALVLRLPAHALNGIHHLALLRQEGVAEIRSPLNVVPQ